MVRPSMSCAIESGGAYHCSLRTASPRGHFPRCARLLRKTGDADPGGRFVAPVDPDQQRGERLDQPGVLEWTCVHESKTRNGLHQSPDDVLRRTTAPADEHISLKRL